MGSGLTPRTMGRYEHVLNQQRDIILKHTQMRAPKAVPILLSTFLVRNLDCKAVISMELNKAIFILNRKENSVNVNKQKTELVSHCRQRHSKSQL